MDISQELVQMWADGGHPTYHWRIIVVLVYLFLPAQIVIVVNDEASILILPLALLRFLVRVGGEIILRQVVGKSRHAWIYSVGWFVDVQSPEL